MTSGYRPTNPLPGRLAPLTLRLTTALAAALAAACLMATTAFAGTPCGPSGYAYAGIQSLQNGHGISARVTALGTPAVESGHVAGWVGVGAPGEGPSGSDAWVQVGLNSLPGTGNTLYYEVTRPYAGTQYVEVARNVPTGRAMKLAVLEVAGRPNSWRVVVNGRSVSPDIELQGSHLRLTPMAMAESWDGGRPACNRYAYKYEQVSLANAPGGSWRAARSTAVLQDRGYHVARVTASSFIASATRPLPAEPAATAAAADVASEPAPARGPQSARAQVVVVKPIAEPVPLRKGVLPVPVISPTPAPTVTAAPAPTAQVVVSEPLPESASLSEDASAFESFISSLAIVGG
jgi:hypothetical protein